MAPKSALGESHHQFINRALSFALWENLFKPVSPLLELVCAGLFVGGAWGRYKFYESLVYLFFRISLMGMDKGIIWYYSEVEEKVYLKSLFRTLIWCFLAFGVLGSVAVGSYYGWIPFSRWVLGGNAEEFRVAGMDLMQYLLVVPMMVITELCLQANVNKHNLKYRILVPGIVVPLVTFGLAIGGRYAAPGVIKLPLCLLAGNTVGAMLAVWGFLRTHRPSWKDISLFAPPPWKMLRYSFPLASANIISAVAVRVDIFMLAGFAGVKSVEVYVVVSMIGKSLLSIRQSFENILLSTFSSSKAGGLSLKLRHYFNYSIWLVMNIQGLLLATIVFFGAEALGLINAQYVVGYYALFITALFIYFNTVTDFSALLALGLGQTAVVPFVNVICLGVNLGLNILWVPRWDTVGAALALGVANTTGGALYFAYLAHRYKSRLLIGEYWLSIAAAGLLLGLPAAGALYFGAGLASKAVLLFLTAGLAFWMQKSAYRRFNHLISGAFSQPSQ